MQDIGSLAREFASCQKLLLALGDENRQHLILEMMQMGQCSGVRVGPLRSGPICPGRRYPIIWGS